MQGQQASQISFQRLQASDLRLMRQTLALYGEVFEDPASYASRPPSDGYLAKLLAKEDFFTIIARDADRVVGALSAYALLKFEQERTEIYIYDLAVDGDYRRQRIATRLIETLKTEGRNLGAYVIFVQADYGDDPAIQLYESLGEREEVLHFDIKLD